jgi:hypothetical protein
MLIPEVITFLESNTRLEAASQGLLAAKQWSGHINIAKNFQKE